MTRIRAIGLTALPVILALGAHGCSPERARAPGDTGADGSVRFDAQVDELLRQMTLDEKLAMMAGSGLDRGLWLSPGVPRLGVSGYAMTDGPRGMGAPRLMSNPPRLPTAFPVGMARGATWDEDLERRVGQAIGAEARAWGANVILAPVVNVLRHPAWGRAQETYGEDPVHLGTMAVAFLQGAQRHVIANAKHFAVNDIEDTRFTVSVNLDERTLREVFLKPFAMTVEAGVGSVMSAYNRVNGTYCSENAHLLGEVLKGSWGYRGFVVSDWVLAVRSTAPSLSAGLDLEMPTPNHYSKDNLGAALDAKAVSLTEVDDAVRRLVRANLELEARRDPTPPTIDVVGSADHAALALEAARKSIVLLRNEGAALPLDRARVKSIAVVGTFAGIARLGDEGSSSVVPLHAVTPLEGLQHRAGGVTIQHIDADLVSATDAPRVTGADAAIVVVGLTASDEGENIPGGAGGDRDGLGLSAAHEALIRQVSALNPRTIVVLEAGSALTMAAWKDSVPAIVMAWYPGQEGGDALADVLFGDVNPSGRLPVTFPVDASQLPPFDHTSTEVSYGYLHGYRYVDRQGGAPAFPFGFGLGYTTFAVSGLALESATVPRGGALRATVNVKNTGLVAGDEVVQLYVGFSGSVVDRPVHELETFARVHLEAGESKTVALEVPARSLAYFDVAANDFKLEDIVYTAFVGSSSRDLPEHLDFRVQ